MSAPKVGDRVRITQGYKYAPGYFAGMTGTLVEVDPDDSNLPYRVQGDGEPSWEKVWAHAVEVVTPVDPFAGAGAGPSRDTLVIRAKELLAGTDHTAADIIRMAAFLTGE
ncbi:MULTISPECIES: hypothetical protein [unclassified Streptomyces]|uniref:hypothetical protein n=1 Tax=unclassified Streptomyces TaxID=2593676 RepID=UPI0003798134|nr:MULTISPECIES: hypothetical protein [unclassified Streptomyces]MYY03104.1 hypothetical protein [Streptomyces sp. SID4913]